MPRLNIPSFRDLNKVVVGLVSIAILAGGVAGAFAIGTLGLFEDRYEMSAVFEDSGGIGSGADVRLAGVEVGRVTGVSADFDTGQVIVSFEVDSGTHLGPQTAVEIAPATLLGGFYLRLSGPVEEPYLEDLPLEERRIPLERTRAPISLIGALGDTTRQVEQLDIDAVNAVIEQLAGTTTRNQEVLPSLLDNLGRLAAAVNEREAQLRSLVDNGQQVSASLAARDEELAQLVDTANVLLDTLSARRDELAVVLGAGSAAVSELAGVIEQHRGSLDAILGNTHVILDAIDRNLPTINLSLAYAGPTFALLAAAGDNGPGFDTLVTAINFGSLDILCAFLPDPGCGQ